MIPIVVIILCAVLAVALQTRFSVNERIVFWCGFVAQLAGTYVLIFITRDIYGYGDMLSYFRVGADIAKYVEGDFWLRFPELISAILQQGSNLPFDWMQRGDPTGSMYGLGALFRIGFGDSLHGACLVLSFAAFTGKTAIYYVFREVFPDKYRTRLGVVVFLFPSAVFWTAGLLKEAIAVAGMGWVFYGAYLAINRKSIPKGVIIAVLGGLLVGGSKPYILFPMAIGFGGWFLWRRSLERGLAVAKPLYIFIGLGLAAGGVFALGQFFPRYAIDQLAEETATLQGYGRRIKGGSSYDIGPASDSGLLGQLQFAPRGLIATLFRPFIWEARNPLSFLNALETSAISLAILFTLFRRRPREIFAMIKSSPTLIFCGIFVFAFSLGVGLATTNLGTLSRYRIPMLPFYGAVIVLLLPFSNWFGRNIVDERRNA